LLLYYLITVFQLNFNVFVATMTASSNLPGMNGDANVRPNDHGRQSDVWKHAPVLIGTTKFEPRPDVKNIMITGGAGFM
jgi:hypothetical protein